MAKSLFTVSLTQSGGSPIVKNVLAQPGSGTALQAAIDYAMTQAATGGATGLALQYANELGGRPADLTITAAVSPATDGTPKAMVNVSYRSGSGANSSTPSPVIVLSNPQTNNGVTTSAVDNAIACASSNGGGAVPNQTSLLGSVDYDATS